LIGAPFLGQKTGKNVYLKLETELPTASFKVAGGVLGAGAENEAGADPGSGGLQHGNTERQWLRSEGIWRCGQDFFQRTATQ